MRGSPLGYVLIPAAILYATAAAAAQPAPQAQPAQPAQQTSGAMQGLAINRDQPVKIEANTLEVRDKSQQATFSGDVKVTQGETVLHCKTLVVFYEDAQAPAPAAGAKKGAPAQKGAPAAAPPNANAPAPGGSGQQIKRLEARGDVLVVQKDQTAKGNLGVFDQKTNMITLSGDVVVTQGTNVLRGDRMTVDLTTNVTNVYSDPRPSGERKRVEGLFNPSTAPSNGAAPAPGPAPGPAAKEPPHAKPAAPPSAKSSPGAPIRIN